MIILENVTKLYGTGNHGLDDVTLQVDKGEFVFLVGHTGSGKTTLMRLLTRELLPSKGSVCVAGIDVIKLPSRKIPQLRQRIGMIFQDLKLLSDRTILENVLLPMEMVGANPKAALKRAEELLQEVGVLPHKDKFPIQLSGGELQRVAIARALTLAPQLILADEPTGNLDPDTALEIVQLLARINAEGTTIVMATHNLDVVDKLKKRIVALEHGKILQDTKGPVLTNIDPDSKKDECCFTDIPTGTEKGSQEEKKSTSEKNNSTETASSVESKESEKEEKANEKKEEKK